MRYYMSANDMSSNDISRENISRENISGKDIVNDLLLSNQQKICETGKKKTGGETWRKRC